MTTVLCNAGPLIALGKRKALQNGKLTPVIGRAGRCEASQTRRAP
jgi:hypothetical protein